MKKRMFVGVAAVAALCVTGALAFQDDATQEASFAPSPEAMAAMAPGPMHAHLTPFAGTWDLTLKWRMGPEAPWSENEFKAERELIMDGRFLTEVISGEWMSMPFTGHAIIGHDNVRGEYTYVWYDNVSTGTSIATGKADDSGHKIGFEGTTSDPWTGEKEKWFKSVLSLEGRDKSQFDMYSKDEAGNEFVSMSIEYRKK